MPGETVTRTWILWFPWIVLGFFIYLKKSLKKVVFDTTFLKFSWLLSLLYQIFSHVLLFYAYAKCSDFKPCVYYAAGHMFSNQYKQSSIYDLFMSSFMLTINQGWCSHGMWGRKRSGNVRESEKECQGGLSVKVRER